MPALLETAVAGQPSSPAARYAARGLGRVALFPAVQTAAFQTLTQRAANSDAALELLGEAMGEHRAAARAAVKHGVLEQLLKKPTTLTVGALCCVRKLATQGDRSDVLSVIDGLCPALITALANKGPLATAALEALASLVAETEEAREKALEHDVPSLLPTIIARGGNLAYQAMHIIEKLCESYDGAETLASAGVLEPLTALISQNGSVESFQLALKACEALKRLVECQPPKLAEAFRNQAAELALDPLGAFLRAPRPTVTFPHTMTKHYAGYDLLFELATCDAARMKALKGLQQVIESGPSKLEQARQISLVWEETAATLAEEEPTLPAKLVGALPCKCRMSAPRTQSLCSTFLEACQPRMLCYKPASSTQLWLCSGAHRLTQRSLPHHFSAGCFNSCPLCPSCCSRRKPTSQWERC